MTDHKGNPIQIGDTISIVATRDDAGRLGWAQLETAEVIELCGVPCYAMKISPRAYLYIDIHSINLFLTDTDIICIKGKSDSEQEYYLDYFRVT